MRIWFSGPRLFGIRTGVSLRAGRGRSRIRSSSPGTDYVYVIRGEHGRIKIGSSINPQARCAELQTGSPYRLWVDHVVPIAGLAAPVEYEAHAILDHRRLIGEWFAIPTEAAIAAIHAAAYRLGVSIGEGDLPQQAAWSPARRFATSVALLVPLFLALSLTDRDWVRALVTLVFVVSLTGLIGVLSARGSLGRLTWRCAGHWSGSVTLGMVSAMSVTAILLLLLNGA